MQLGAITEEPEAIMMSLAALASEVRDPGSLTRELEARVVTTGRLGGGRDFKTLAEPKFASEVSGRGTACFIQQERTDFNVFRTAKNIMLMIQSF